MYFVSKNYLVSHYKTLLSYNLNWVVCHLFPQQRWRTHTYSVSGNHWSGEPRDQLKTTSAFKFRPAFFGADSKTRIFYKYVVFKHSFSFSQFLLQRWHALSSVTLLFTNRSKKPQKWISLADIHFFKTHWLRHFFEPGKHRLFRNTRRNRHFKYVINLNRTLSLLTFVTHTHTHIYIYTQDYFKNNVELAIFLYQCMFCYEYKFVLFVALFWMFLLSAPFHIFIYLLNSRTFFPFAFIQT